MLERESEMTNKLPLLLLLVDDDDRLLITRVFFCLRFRSLPCVEIFFDLLFSLLFGVPSRERVESDEASAYLTERTVAHDRVRRVVTLSRGRFRFVFDGHVSVDRATGSDPRRRAAVSFASVATGDGLEDSNSTKENEKQQFVETVCDGRVHLKRWIPPLSSFC